MDLSLVYASLGGAGVLAGAVLTGIWGRKQNQADTLQMQQMRIDALESDKAAKDLLVSKLEEQVRVLTELVTQKADVERVKEQLALVQETIDRMEAKLDQAIVVHQADPH
jgi:hypothetical protein